MKHYMKYDLTTISWRDIEGVMGSLTEDHPRSRAQVLWIKIIFARFRGSFFDLGWA